MAEAPKRTAAGYVLWRPAGATGRTSATPGHAEYLLLVNAERGEAGFPKGHAEAGEDLATTARRETEEETGLTDFDVAPTFRRDLVYAATRKGETYEKTVAYGLARWRSGEVTLSGEHASAAWLPWPEASRALPFITLRNVLREAALWIRDRALVDEAGATEPEALAHLRVQPELTEHLEKHLVGGAALARRLAEALRDAGATVDPEAAAVATVLHDIGRARGQHDDHPRAGLRHLRLTHFAPYAPACWTHFTKGAPPEALVTAGVSPTQVDEVATWIDPHAMSWEERCAAVADGCMKGTTPVHPDARFADLRQRYDAEALIALQEARVHALLREMHAVLGTDPLELLPL
ncbi:MAG: NUDIX domain-containing protein [Planctomycetes bacterium]|nr:NUDIX domain-containing protein [Planctomycetota bacterium]MCB9830709.1 NUDIX domain-containing protein [Planctomycetota bacterium]MCB9902686.1 NUDIX domain-containing protein [Planctomycetota bacterium]